MSKKHDIVLHHIAAIVNGGNSIKAAAQRLRFSKDLAIEGRVKFMQLIHLGMYVIQRVLDDARLTSQPDGRQVEPALSTDVSPYERRG